MDPLFSNMDSFRIKLLEEDNFYGFELDGNHRYLTGDYFVHHNSNGKSFLMEFIIKTLGDQYIRALPMSFLTEQGRSKSANADPSLMELKYARTVIFSESEENEKANISKIKKVTGQETISSRGLFKDQENFKPNCNYLVTTNYTFTIESQGYAIWRRIITYAFKMIFMNPLKGDSKYERIADEELINRCLNDKKIQEAFLSILVHYRCMLYEKYDGKITAVPRPTLDKETLAYRNREDIFNRFIDYKCYIDKENIQTLDEIISIFRAYYKSENGENYKGINSNIKSIFNNSKLHKYMRCENGITRVYGIRIAEDGYIPDKNIKLLTSQSI
jgi:phage/plasmid-associated DNA primase